MRLKKDLAEKSLLKRIGLFNRLCGMGERGLGFYLLDFTERGLYRKFGFSSTTQFALMRFQISPKKTHNLLRIARTIEELPLIDEAFAKGEVSWSSVRELTRVATRETEKEWLDFARGSTLRAIERAVSGVRRGERPPKDAYGLTRTKLKVVAELPIEDHAVWQAAFDRVAATRGEEMDASTALLVLAKSYLERSLDRTEAGVRKAFQVVYHRCESCGRAWIETGDGPAGVPADLVAEREKEAEVIRLEGNQENDTMVKAGMAAAMAKVGEAEARSAKVARTTRVRGKSGDGPAKNRDEGASEPKSSNVGARTDGTRFAGESSDIGSDPRGPRGPLVSAPNSPVVPKEKRDKPNTPSIRRRVLSRDGQRCAVPGCLNKGHLVGHHVLWRSHGGATEMENEIAICRSCHSLIHEGLLQVSGRSSEGLIWLDGNGEPLRTGIKGGAGNGEEKLDEINAALC